MDKKDYTIVESWSISDLIDALTESNKKRKIIIPKYQRGLVWKSDQKKLFIDSIKDGFPIGSLLLFKTNGDTYSLTDGLQRTSTLLDYSKNPTKYFEKTDIPDELIKLLNLNKYGDDIKDCIVSWTKLRKGFQESDGFSSSKLAQEIDKTLSLSLSKEKHIKLGDNLVHFIENLKKQSDIFNSKIPVIIYTGDEDNLPTIFERLNSQGTQLSKYQIYAATWANYKFKIKNKVIISNISQKYESLIAEGLQIDGFSSDTRSQEKFATEEFTFFEYLFGLGKYLTETYKDIFGESKREEESIGFNLTAICLGVSIRTMKILPESFKNITNNYNNQEEFEKALFDSIVIAQNILKPYTNPKFNSKGVGKKAIYHSEFQIISIVAKIFQTKYDLKNLNLNLELRDLKRLQINIPYHYLYHILQGYWGNNGDNKAFSECNSENYKNPISHLRWEELLNRWNDEQINQKHKSRTSLPKHSILFLKYIYTHLITTYQEYSDLAFEIEHLVPIKQVEDEISHYGGMPINHIGNLTLLDKKLNNAKKDDTIYQYHFYNRGAVNLKEVEKLTFTVSKDLSFTGVKERKVIELNAYNEFVTERFKTLKRKFYSLNNIIEKPDILQPSLFNN
jgi:uncharacterized protein with ParB-like and HNH nuclease domain